VAEDAVQATVDRPARAGAERAPWTARGFRRGMVAAIPVGIGVAAYGLVFGVLSRQVGLSLLEVVLMNTLVFAGAAQTAALDLWTHPLPIAAIVVTTLLINLRNLLLGASIRPWIGHHPGRRVYPWLHILADEGWALAMSRHARGERDVGFLFGALAAVGLSWVPSVIVGFLLGGRIGDPAAIGLDFAFTAIFAAMLIGTWRSRFDLGPWAAAGLAAWLAHLWLPGTWYVVIGAVAGCAVAALTIDPARAAIAPRVEDRP
jgi:4-azaleucine resistance transporter AzlC